MQCTVAILKPFLFIGNFLLNLVGLGLIAAGVYIQVTYNEYVQLLNADTFITAPMIMIVLGVVIALLGFVGCCGAISESHRMMNTYAFLLTTLLIVQVAAAGFVYVYRDTADGTLVDTLKKTMTHYKSNFVTMAEPDKLNMVTNAWDGVQYEWQCCGVNSYADWRGSNATIASGNQVPYSCCKRVEGGGDPKNTCAQRLDLSRARINEKGCLEQIRAFVADNTQLMYAVAISAIVVQLMVVVLACCFAHALSSDAKRGKY